VPEFAIHPGDARDHAVALDGADDRAGLRVDLMDLLAAVFADPQRSLRPGEAGIPALAGGGDGGENRAGSRVDLANAILGDLKEVSPVIGGAGMGGDVDRTQHVAAFGIDGFELVAGCEPDVLAVEGHAMHLFHIGEGAVFAQDMCL
jgi:hypothetical protein